MTTIYHWFLRQFGKLVLLPDYFRVLAKEWLNILFGETLVGIAFLLWWSLAGPSNAKLIVVFVAAMFVRVLCVACGSRSLDVRVRS